MAAPSPPLSRIRSSAPAAVWLAVHLPRLALDALVQNDTGCVVTHARGSRRWIVAATDAQLAAGMDLGLARMRRPELRALERQPARELQMLETLACAAYGFGDRICFRVDEPELDFGVPRFTLWLEIGASLRLFGGIDALLVRLDREFAMLGQFASFGIASTLESAAALARAGAPPAPAPEDLANALCELPLSLLALPAAALDLLTDSGLRHTGEVLNLPRDALARRIGKTALSYLDRVTGAAPDIRRWYRPPARFVRHLDFEVDIEESERLLFALRRLFDELARYLGARATGVQQFQVELEHPRLDGTQHPPTVIEFTLGLPSRDAGLLLRVARDKLAVSIMSASVRALSLVASRFAAPPTSQHDLFDTRPRIDEEAASAVDRLAARLGKEAIWRPYCVEDHRPERAWRSAPADDPAVAASSTAVRPAFLLREARRLRRPPPIVGDIERIESGWWDGRDARRDYFVCELDGGVRGWAYADRRDGQIYLHGLWA